MASANTHMIAIVCPTNSLKAAEVHESPLDLVL
jgi:hypothetical protein